MSQARRPRTLALAACLAVATLSASCSRPADHVTAAQRSSEVVVASFNFSESTLLAEIYAQAIEAAGIPVRREMDLGPRELVQPALLAGMVDLVPEYLGSALTNLGQEPAGPADMSSARDRLVAALQPWRVRVMEPAAAEDQNGLVVSRETARRYGLDTVSDLLAVPGELSLAGPPECPVRPYCLPGLEARYGLHFGRFVPLDTDRQRATAIAEQVVDVAVMFSSDGRLATGDLVLLRDDRELQPAENVVPVLSAAAIDRYGARLVEAVDGVSSHLTSNSLSFLNWRVDVAGRDTASEARGWLERQTLVSGRS